MLEGHKQNLVHTRAQEKGAVTPQETNPDLPVSVQEFLVEVWDVINGNSPEARPETQGRLYGALLQERDREQAPHPLFPLC